MTMIEDFFTYRPSPQEVTKAFQADLAEIEETTVELAHRMRHLGDHRTFEAILRGIQRMAAGDTNVSGEMMVIMRLLLLQQRRRDEKYSNVKWDRHNNGTVSALVDGFSIDLYPKAKNRWHVNLEHLETKYRPAWPAWQDDLVAAKKKALTCLEDAINHLDDVKNDRPYKVPTA